MLFAGLMLSGTTAHAAPPWEADESYGGGSPQECTGGHESACEANSALEEAHCDYKADYMETFSGGRLECTAYFIDAVCECPVFENWECSIDCQTLHPSLDDVFVNDKPSYLQALIYIFEN